jgi:hypothetical protein
MFDQIMNNIMITTRQTFSLFFIGFAHLFYVHTYYYLQKALSMTLPDTGGGHHQSFTLQADLLPVYISIRVANKILFALQFSNICDIM